MLTKADLHPYQLQAIDWMSNHDSGMLWLGLGGGKTIISLSTIAETEYTTLVVSTKRIIEHTWPREIDLWEHTQHLKYAACTGTPKQRLKAIEGRFDILGISYENLPWFYTLHRAQDRFRLMIFDEVSKMKAHDTQRLRIHRKLCQIPRRFGLTATPAPEGYVGLWGQFAAVVDPNPLGKNITQFRDAFVTSVYKGMYTEYKVTDRDKARIEKVIEPHVLVLEAPKREAPTVVDVVVPWENEDLFKSYKQMERNLILELEGKTLALASRSEAYGKCRQMSTGFVYDQDKRGNEIDATKLALIKEEYEALGGEPVLIFYQYVWEREALVAALPGAELFDNDSLERFNRGSVAALVVHPRSAGYGLNLQGSCRHVFWSTLPDSATDYLQANGRIDRQGQTGQVVIKRFVRERSVEVDLVLPRVEEKVVNQEELVARMKERQ